MSRSLSLAILLAAALCEAGGDALIRRALHEQSVVPRALLFLAGAAILFAYGLIVNAPNWDFGRLLGIYVVFFFVIAQVMSTVVFHQPPSAATFLGGALIVAGGLVLGLAGA